MENKLCVIVCENFKREAGAVIQSERLDDVILVTFDADCDPFSSGSDALVTLIADCKEKYGRVYLVSGCCLPDPGSNAGGSETHENQNFTRCFDCFSSKAFNDWLAGQGAYLMTPGWLENWRRYIRSWGFDRQTASDFFAESGKRLVLLDTGVYGDADKHLEEFAGFVGLPGEAIPIGLEMFQSILKNAVLEWRLRTDGRDSASNEAKKPVSDYAMAFDLLGSLAGARTEAQAIENMLDLFTRMFAPGKLRFCSLANGRARDLSNTFTVMNPAEIAHYSKAMQDDFEWTESGSGFVLRVGEKDNPLGVLELDDLAFPQYREQYLALAMVMARVCAMAIINGRSYEEMAGLNDALARRSAELEASNAELEAFCYSVSHDLRAPLRSAEGFSTVLLEDYGDRLDSQGKEYLVTIQKSSQLMAQLIDALLNLSRMTRQEMRWETVDLSGIAHSVIDELKKNTPGRQVRVAIAPALFCQGDARLLRVALDNLLGNAWKFTGKVTSPAIEVGVTDQEGVAAYYVRDNGAGFDMAYADKLFQPFQRLHTSEQFEGTGIGLANVQRIVRRHGGRVWAEGKVGEGATFFFTLGK
ncbi:MAG: DUF1638 domain-containing protein [Chloroflexi bacterium]|nr:DUF1638 domain-containing protein [Chloroflexota bacterium]